LSKHVSVDRMTEFLAPDGVEMVFPERTLHGIEDFRDWYAVVGRPTPTRPTTSRYVSVTGTGDSVRRGGRRRLARHRHVPTALV